tara:strand:- start:307 stop:465 length:159 start_codon:yes stop_codon:yes gene_type:complete
MKVINKNSTTQTIFGKEYPVGVEMDMPFDCELPPGFEEVKEKKALKKDAKKK